MDSLPTRLCDPSEVMSLLTDDMTAWIGRRETSPPLEISRRDIVKYSLATEQRLDKYRRGDEAPPLFLFGALRPLLPLDELRTDGLPPDPLLPDLPLPRVMAGGSTLRYFAPIHPGDVLVGTRVLSDMVEKQGSQGPLIFITYTLTVVNQNGETVLEETQTRIAR